MRFFLIAVLLSPQQDDTIRELISRLGHDDPGVRDRASEDLGRKGLEAIPLLESAAEDPDSEVRLRARDILPVLLQRRSFRDALAGATDWLVRHQSKAGSWSAREALCGCPADDRQDNAHEAGLTGLSILALLRNPLPDDRSAAAVRRAAAWIVDAQAPDGSIGIGSGSKCLYDHAFSTLALGELCARSPSPELKKSVRRAADYLIEAQNPGKGWRYSSLCGDNDTSSTFWCGLALLASRSAGIEIPEPTIRGALSWLGEVTESNGYASVGYTWRDWRRVTLPGKNEQFDRHPATTAQGHLLRRLLRAPDGERGALLSSALLLADLPDRDPNKRDFCYWYVGTLAIRELKGPQGPRWARWASAARPVLLGLQKSPGVGCARGSWDPEDPWSDEAGRVYATAMNTLTLELLAPPKP